MLLGRSMCLGAIPLRHPPGRLPTKARPILHALRSTQNALFLVMQQSPFLHRLEVGGSKRRLCPPHTYLTSFYCILVTSPSLSSHSFL